MTFQRKPRGIRGRTYTKPIGRPPEKRQKALVWLKGYLSGGQQRLEDVWMLGAAEGYSRRLLEDCKKELGVVSVCQWYWTFPGPVAQTSATVLPEEPSGWTDDDLAGASATEIQEHLADLTTDLQGLEKWHGKPSEFERGKTVDNASEITSIKREIDRARQWLAKKPFPPTTPNRPF